MEPLRNPNDPIHITFYKDLFGPNEVLYSLVASVTDAGVIKYECRGVGFGGATNKSGTIAEQDWAVDTNHLINREGEWVLPRVNQQGWQSELLGWLEQWHYADEGTDHCVYEVQEVIYGTARA